MRDVVDLLLERTILVQRAMRGGLKLHVADIAIGLGKGAGRDQRHVGEPIRRRTISFYPPSHQGVRAEGLAADFATALKAFEQEWRCITSLRSPMPTDANTCAEMLTSPGLPATEAGGGRPIAVLLRRRDYYRQRRHPYRRGAHDLNKFVAPRPYADPEAAARKIVELANAVEIVQDGRIYIEKINGPMLFEWKATPAEYKAGLDRAIQNGWLEPHESGTLRACEG